MNHSLLSFLLSVLAAPLPAQTNAQFTKISGEIRAQMERRGAPSVAVAVARHGEILWEAAFGWADREARIEATPETVYALASVTKPMTATGLMRLVERGKIDLDTPANEYLGEARLTAMIGSVEAATIRTIANHTSGLTTQYNLFFDDEVHRPTSREESIRRWGVLMSPPGERHEYSNFGYNILSHIIARVSDMPFSDFMKDEVFAPLGMDSTSVGRPEGAEVAVRYMEGGARFPATSSTGSGSGGIYSSVNDLIRFGMFHLGDLPSNGSPVLSAASLAEMHRPTAKARLPFVDVGYAIGWRTWRSAEGDHLVVQHTGLMEGATANLTLLPEEGLAIAALVNEAGFLAQAAVDIVGEELFGVRYLDAPKRAPDSPAAVAELLSALAGEWRGTVVAYDGDVPIEVRLKAAPAMQVRLDGGAWTDARGVTVRGNTLSGTFPGERVPGSEWRRWPTNMTLTFRQDGDRVTATLFADAVPDPVKGVPFGFTLWVDAKRTDGR